MGGVVSELKNIHEGRKQLKFSINHTILKDVHETVRKEFHSNLIQLKLTFRRSKIKCISISPPPKKKAG